MYDKVIIYCTEETKSNDTVKIWKELCGENTESYIVGPGIKNSIESCFNISFPFLLMPVVEKSNWKYIIAGGLIGGISTIVAVPVLLAAAGFTSAGIAGGSIAATIQSIFYGGATSGAFSVLQSAGAAGISLLGNVGIFGGSAATGSGLGYLFAKNDRRNSKDLLSSIKTKIVGLYRKTEEIADINLIKDFVDNHLKLSKYTQNNFEVSMFTEMIDRRYELKTPAVLMFSDIDSEKSVA